MDWCLPTHLPNYPWFSGPKLHQLSPTLGQVYGPNEPTKSAKTQACKGRGDVDVEKGWAGTLIQGTKGSGTKHGKFTWFFFAGSRFWGKSIIPISCKFPAMYISIKLVKLESHNSHNYTRDLQRKSSYRQMQQLPCLAFFLLCFSNENWYIVHQLLATNRKLLKFPRHLDIITSCKSHTSYANRPSTGV